MKKKLDSLCCCFFIWNWNSELFLNTERNSFYVRNPFLFRFIILSFEIQLAILLLLLLLLRRNELKIENIKNRTVSQSNETKKNKHNSIFQSFMINTKMVFLGSMYNPMEWRKPTRNSNLITTLRFVSCFFLLFLWTVTW